MNLMAKFTLGVCVFVCAFSWGSRAEIEQELQNRSLLYFLENSDFKTGLVRVIAKNFEPTPSSRFFNRSSIAATGFGLAVIANASERRLTAVFDDGRRFTVTPSFAIEYGKKVLFTVAKKMPHHHGWLPHFIEGTSGKRYDRSEFSTIDTALFLAGALYAAQMYPILKPLVMPLYERVNYTEMLTDGQDPKKLSKETLSMAYEPEHTPKYSKHQWNDYAEHMILLFLGMAHPTRPVSTDKWTAWNRESLEVAKGKHLIGYNKPLFTHQYSQLFIDFRKFRDAYGNYFDNAALATLYNRDTCRKDSRYATFRSGFWGLSAGDAPEGYRAFTPMRYQGVVCLACAAASVMYLPDLVWPDVENWRSFKFAEHPERPIFGRYGFADGIDLDGEWVAPLVHAITVGPLFLAIANQQESTSVWKHFMKLPGLKEAMDAAASAVPQ